MRLFTTLAALAVFAASPLSFGNEPGPQPVAFSIASQPLTEALDDLSHQAGVQVLHRTAGGVPEPMTHSVTGVLSLQEALERLLEGTGYRYELVNDRTVRVWMPAKQDSPQSDGSKSADSPFGAVRADQAPAGSQGVQPKETSSGPPAALEEVVVTAQKREERLQDVPVPVTAISGDTLVNSNQLLLQDYYASVPGLSLTPTTASSLILAIRGVTTGQTNPTVGVTVDDVPYGSTTLLGGGTVVPDIDPGDLARVEVLRGPQGTLYGASSMGGLLKFVTADPSTDSVGGRIQAGLSGVQNGADIGYNVRGSVNLPINDTLAVRASAFTRRDPGYIDNPVLHVDGINEARINGGRLSALWRPLEDFTLKLSALYQESKSDGSNDVDLPVNGYVGPTLGPLQQNYAQGAGAYDRKVQAYSATLSEKRGGLSLTSVTGYNINSFHDSFDYTYALGGLTQGGYPAIGFSGFGVSGAPVFNANSTRKFSEEVRLSAPLGRKVEWLLGYFYTHENSPYSQTILAEDPITGVKAGTTYYSPRVTTYAEYAAFTDFTFRLTDRFDVQVGGRESQIKQTLVQTEVGPFVPIFALGAPSPYVIPELQTKGNAFTYLVTPRFKISPDMMIYARLASGYRPGGPNSGLDVPRKFDPDKTQNYELGLKGDFLEHRLSVDASIYYIDWKDIQLSLLNPQTFQGYDANAGRAKSQGLELSLESRPLTGLIVAAWATWNDAELTEALPANSTAAGNAGDRLPNTSRFSGNLSVQQDFPLGSDLTGFVGGSLSYVGQRESYFLSGTSARQILPAYSKADLRAGTHFNSWTVNVFVNNVTDRRGVLTGGLGAIPPFSFDYIQPRSFGVSLVKLF